MSTPEEKEEVKKEKKKNDSGIVTKESVGAVCALFSVLALLILFTRASLFGEIGLQVHMILTGTFGYAAYPLFVWFAYLSAAAFFGFSLVKNKKAAAAFGVAVVALVLLAQTAVGMANGALDSESYLSDCFNAGETFPVCTVAGWLGALPVYGLSKLATPIGAVVIFAVIALGSVYLTALFVGKKPFKKSAKSRGKRLEEAPEAPVAEQPAPAMASGMQTPVRPVEAAEPMPGYQSAYDPSSMGGYYPYSTAQVHQRPGVMLSPDGTPVQRREEGGVFSPFGATGVGQPQTAQRPMTYEESREILFGVSPAESYRRNLIFDSNASVNKRPAADPVQPTVTSTPQTYSAGYTDAVNRDGETPVRSTRAPSDFERAVPSYTAAGSDGFSTYERREPPVSSAPATDGYGFGGERRAEYSPYELRTDDRLAGAIGEERRVEEPPVSPIPPVDDAYTLRTPTVEPIVSTAEPSASERRGDALQDESSGEYRRHEYMDLFSLDNPNIFGRERTDEETEAAVARDRSTLFDETEDEQPRTVEEPFTRRTEFDAGTSFSETRRVEESRSIEGPSVKAVEPVAAPKEEPSAPPAPKPRVHKPYVRIPLDYFDCSDVEPEANEMEVEHIKRMILGTLADYKVVDATIASVTFGPTVTRYNVVIPRNISPKKVVALEQEIAISLCSSGVNIYPSFEDGAVSIEVPNKTRQDVLLGCMLSDPAFTKAKATSLTFAMGKDVANRKVYGDICKMTHLLVAGSSGSGKSAFLASLIISLIVKYSPEELRLILIDPKKTEFVLYNNLPHLMINEIITDSGKAVQSLNWAIGEMNRRYGLFEKMSLSGTYVVNIDEYNSHLSAKEEKLPKIVIIIDELADLMQAAEKEMESKIQNLTQKARAAGIHLVLATQRPSVDVITGVIKSNLSTRFAFTVATEQDSRVILDQQGAHKLLGRGDMLYTMSGINTPVRVQGAFIPPAEAQKVVQFIKANNEAYYDEAATSFINNARSAGGDSESGGFTGDNIDETYITALKMVIQTGGASISMLQRKCSIGFNKAGKIIEWMEMMEYISPFEGSARARKVLITKEEFERLYGEF